MNGDLATRISTASGDAGALLALAIELAQENASLRAQAEQLQSLEVTRKEKQAERTRRHRNGVSRDVTLQSVTERDGSPSPLPSSSFPTPHITTSFPPSPPKALSRAKRLQTDERFERLWAAYPKRHGGNSRSEGLGAWRARLAAGVDPDAMLAGVERYAAFVRAMGKEGTEFVKQAKSFLGPGRHWEEPWSAAVVVVDAATSATSRAAVLWARYKAAGLLARPSREVLQTRGNQLVADGLYPDYETFLAEVKVTKPWDFADARHDNFAIADLAKRLAAA